MDITQRRNLAIMLWLWFYVKSILADFRRSRTAVLTIMEALNFDFWKNFTLENVKSSQKFKIQSYSNGQNGSFLGASKWPKLISHKIWPAEKSWNFRIVYSQLGCPGLYIHRILIDNFTCFRCIVLRRIFLLVGIHYYYRAVTMYVTALPKPNPDYYCEPKLNHTTPLIIFQRVLRLLSGMGLSINGKHNFCGDYIYSGHTMTLIMTYLVIKECK